MFFFGCGCRHIFRKSWITRDPLPCIKYDSDIFYTSIIHDKHVVDYFSQIREGIFVTSKQ